MNRLCVSIFAASFSVAVAAAEDAKVNDFWNFSEAYETPVVSVQTSVSTEKATGFSRQSVWDDMAEAFSTFVRGFSVRFW